MKAADLRKSILQAAVQGKLVPQDKNDEPASELLKRIQAEKAVLIKEGKFKKEKPLSPITEDEIPYDMPDGWAWCRLGEITHLIMGQSPEGNSVTGNNVSGSIEFHQGKICFTEKYLKPSNSYTTMPTKIAPANSVLLAVRAPVGKVNIVQREVCIGRGLCAISPLASMALDFLFYWVQSLETELISKATGTTFIAVTRETVQNQLIPLPPLAEQQRIVAKVDELMTMCDELEAAEKELDALESHFFDYLPKSILHAAVQGKLVPQNKNDEPASELLKRIQAEKAVLIKEGKLKKEKPLPPITEDEIPYDLPDGWAWCRLGSLIQLLSGRDLEPRLYNDLGKGIPYITGASALIDNKIDVVRWTEHPVTVSTLQDILLSCKGTVGKIVHNTIGDCHIARQIMAIRTPYMDINKDYLAIVLKTFVPQLVDQAKSMIPGISRDDVLNLLYPIPPLVEQQRIVAKVDELMAMCDELKRVADQPISHDNVIPFPAVPKEKDEPIAMAARGEVEGMSDQAKQAIEDLFGDDE